MPTYDTGRIRHAMDLMHYSKGSNGSSIPSNWIPAATGDSGVGWQPQSASSTASGVTIVDAGGYFTATDVEAALQELAKKDIGYTAHGNTGATETFDALTGWHSATVDMASTFTFTGATSGIVAAMVLELAEAGFAVTWPASVSWPGGVAPTLSATGTDILMFFSRDGGTTWFGFMAGSGSSSGAAHYLVIATSHSTPLVFADIVQTTAGDDFIYTT